MAVIERYKELKTICESLDDNSKNVVDPLLQDIAFMENKLRVLRELPHIRVHPKYPERQEVTPAGKQYKETLQSYINAIKVVMSALNKIESSAADELLAKLEEFQ